MNDIPDQNIRLLEAILFASTDPVKERSLANRLPEGVEVRPLLEELKSHYQGRGVNLVNAGGSWAFRSAADLTNMLNREIEVARKLGRATIETLAIIAYHQPITRGEIEEIRGVSLSKGTFDVLFDHGWIHPRGRRKTPGRPTTWGTTDGFLDHFGLESIKDLPGIEELKSAGLLDKRPAIDAYSISGLVAASAADVAHIDGADAQDDEAELPLAADLEEEE
ncbi:MAG: SMC-Scp complex subunit ScpB [Rhodospirillales bacterium]|nr:SMC-Scp complex subunit ScpB [Rhodospirillales bacterium]